MAISLYQVREKKRARKVYDAYLNRYASDYSYKYFVASIVEWHGSDHSINELISMVPMVPADDIEFFSYYEEAAFAFSVVAEMYGWSL